MSISERIKLDEYVPDNSQHSAPGLAASSSSTPANGPPLGRKTDRACDFCRKRKTRCDGSLTHRPKCTNCRRNNTTCTYNESSRPRGPSKAYVTALEDRVERFEKLLKRLRPDTDFTDVLGPQITRGSWKNDDEDTQPLVKHSSSFASTSSSTGARQSPVLPSYAGLLRANDPRTTWTSSSESEASSSDEELGLGAPIHSKTSTRQMRLEAGAFSQDLFWDDGERPDPDDDPCSMRFCGKSSVYTLIHNVRKLKAGSRDGSEQDTEPPQSMKRGVAHSKVDVRREAICGLPRYRRESYWNLFPWEIAWERKRTQQPSPSSNDLETDTSPIFQFPPLDLVSPLITLYFKYTNIFFPLLHYPTFYNLVSDGLQHRDVQFAAVLWCVIAIGSRWSEDQRVLWGGWGSGRDGNKVAQPGDGGGKDWTSAGWRFFLRALDAPSFAVTSLRPPTLHDVQSCALASSFLRGSSVHPAGWTLVSVGLRKAIDVGAHRKKFYGTKPSVENELWKRAFWVLVYFDRIGSAAIGRPCCMHEEDFDLDLPLEVDDEYWIVGTPTSPGFRQPRSRPSLVSAFICLLKISQIYAHASRTIYGTEKSKDALQRHDGGNWQVKVVSRLNEALDEWLDSVPQHLRWRKGIASLAFFNQSSTIYVTYYLALIFIYRPFFNHPVMLSQRDAPSSKDVKSFPFPAFAICTNAARAGLNIIEETLRQCPGLPWNVPYYFQVMVNSVGVFEMQKWAAKSGRTVADKGKERDADPGEWDNDDIAKGLETCERLLELIQDRWVLARNVLKKMRETEDISLNADLSFPTSSHSDANMCHWEPTFGSHPSLNPHHDEVHEMKSQSRNDGQSGSTNHNAFAGQGQVDGVLGGQPSFRIVHNWPGQDHSQQAQHYHHTPFYLRQPGETYGSTGTGQHRPSESDPIIMHRESAVRHASSQNALPRYPSHNYHDGAPYGVHADGNAPVYSSAGHDPRFAIPGASRAMSRSGSMSVPMDVPGAMRHPEARSPLVPSYSMGGT